MSEILKIDDIINLLDTANKSLESGFFIASNPENPIIVKPLNAHHSKNIIRSLIDGNFASTQFTLAIYNILKDIITVPLTDLTILDKNLILLQLRQKNINDLIDVDLNGTETIIENESEITQNKVINHKISINKMLSNFKKGRIFPTAETVDQSGYSVNINYPSIEEEYRFDDNFYKTKILPLKEDDMKGRRALSAPIFINTIAQYIKIVTIGDKVIELSKRKIDERLAITEKLPTSLLMKIIEKIDEKFGKPINELTSISIKKDDVNFTGDVVLNAKLFISN